MSIDQDESKQERNTKLRQALGHAYGTILGEQNSQSMLAFSFEEALEQQIELISGDGTKIRPNLLTRVKQVEQELLQAVAEIRSLPPEAFETKTQEIYVNTPEVPQSTA